MQSANETPPKNADTSTRKSLRFFDKKMCAFLGMYFAIHKFTSAWIPLDLVARLSTPKDKLYLIEKVPSAIHLIHIKKSFQGEGLLVAYPPLLDTIFANHAAFTLYDMWVMAIKGKEHTSVWIHHALGFVGTTAMRFYQKGAFFPAAFCITELTGLVSNVVWIMQKLQMEKSKGFSLVLQLRVIAFVLLRMSSLPFVLLYTFVQKKNSLKNKESGVLPSLLEDISILPKPVSILSTLNMAVLFGFNTWWTLLCIRAVKRNSKTVHHI